MDKAHSHSAPRETLRVESLSSRYGAKQVLDKVSFAVSHGEIFVIMGSSGSGKTTLLRHLLGLRPPNAGSVTILGQRLDSLNRKDLYALRKHIGVAFQHGALINALNVIDNVELPLRQNTVLDPHTIRIMSRMKLEMMSLTEAELLMPAELSGGMLKRAGLARAVIMDPQLLFFDEPSAGLDPVTAAGLDDLLKGLRDALGMTMIVITHDVDSALAIADRIMILADRRVATLGTVAEVKQSSDPDVQAMLQRRAKVREPEADYLDKLTR